MLLPAPMLVPAPVPAAPPVAVPVAVGLLLAGAAPAPPLPAAAVATGAAVAGAGVPTGETLIVLPVAGSTKVTLPAASAVALPRDPLKVTELSAALKVPLSKPIIWPFAFLTTAVNVPSGFRLISTRFPVSSVKLPTKDC